MPASVTADITLEGVAAELAAAGIQVLAIDVGALDSTYTNTWGSCPAPETQPPQASTLAAATGGSYTNGKGPRRARFPQAAGGKYVGMPAAPAGPALCTA